MSERMPKDMSEGMSEDMSERMAMSERMSEDMSERMSKDMSQRTRIHVCTNGILWMAFCFLFDVAHCSKYCWLNFFVQGSEFGLAAMAEVVVERPETIFIGTANRFAKGVEHVWRYKLTFVGAERIYVCMEPPSTTHAGDCMFILPEVVEGNMWYVAYGGLFQMRRASKSWRSVLQSFALRPRFGRMECTSGRQMMCGAEPPTQTK